MIDASKLRRVVDWGRILVLPPWLTTTLAAWPHPLWLVVVETVLVTLLVYWAAERLWRRS